MKFLVDIDKERYNSFVSEHEKAYFLQSSEWGEFKSIHEWDMKRVGVEKDGQLVAASLILLRHLPVIKKPILYSPRGFILDFKDKELTAFFIEQLKAYGKELGAVFIKVDPYIPYKELDLEGNLVEGGFSNEWLLEDMESYGFTHKGFELNFDGIQPRFSIRLDIKRDEEEILNELHQKTRYNIRLAEKKGIEIIEGTREDLPKFHEIMKVTGERDEFVTRSLTYFEEMYDTLVPANQMKLFLAKFNLDKGIENVQQEIKQVNKQQKTILKKIAKIENEEELQVLREKSNEVENKLQNLGVKEIDLKELKANNPAGITISGAILTTFGNKAEYLYGASDNVYRNLMPNYLLQWEMIKWAKDHNCDLYDFGGISGDLSPEHPLYGLYRFKKGFNGEFIEFVGEFDLILNKPLYFAWEILLPKFKKLRKKFLKKA